MPENQVENNDADRFDLYKDFVDSCRNEVKEIRQEYRRKWFGLIAIITILGVILGIIGFSSFKDVEKGLEEIKSQMLAGVEDSLKRGIGEILNSEETKILMETRTLSEASRIADEKVSDIADNTFSPLERELEARLSEIKEEGAKIKAVSEEIVVNSEKISKLSEYQETVIKATGYDRFGFEKLFYKEIQGYEEESDRITSTMKYVVENTINGTYWLLNKNQTLPYDSITPPYIENEFKTRPDDYLVLFMNTYWLTGPHDSKKDENKIEVFVKILKKEENLLLAYQIARFLSSYDHKNSFDFREHIAYWEEHGYPVSQ